MTSLHNITGNYLAIQDMMKDPEADPQAMLDTLEGIEGELTVKAENIVHVVQNIGTDVTAIDEYIKALTARKQVIQNKEKWVTNYLKENMKAAGITKIECPLFTITLMQGREVVHIDDVESIPDDFVNIKTSVTPDKKLIAAEFKAGNPVEGCHMERNEPSLRIKT